MSAASLSSGTSAPQSVPRPGMMLKTVFSHLILSNACWVLLAFASIAFSPVILGAKGSFELALSGFCNTSHGELHVLHDHEELAKSLADHIVAVSDKCVKARGACSVVLSGDYLVPLLTKLTEPGYSDKVDWAKWRVFWVDERVVPKDSSDSNYNYANRLFLSKVPIVRDHIYAISDTLNAEEAADDYEAVLKNLVKEGILEVTENDRFPVFDLMLLGMGPDGHIASLFPGHPLLLEKKRWVTYILDSPKLPPHRITFTLPVINSALDVTMVITGARTSTVLKRVFGDNSNEKPPLPVQMVQPTNGTLIWFTDEAAASQITC